MVDIPRNAEFGLDFVGPPMSGVVDDKRDASNQILNLLEQHAFNMEILPNPGRTQWRYRVLKHSVILPGQSRVYSVGILDWIPPYYEHNFNPCAITVITNYIEVRRIISVANPVVALICWWKDRNPEALDPKSLFLADLMVAALLSVWFSHYLMGGTHNWWFLAGAVVATLLGKLAMWIKDATEKGVSVGVPHM